MPKLSDSQLVVLTRAANHASGLVEIDAIAAKAPVVRHNIVKSLLGKALIEEVDAGREDPVWRKTESGIFALQITTGGKAALGIESEPEAAPEPTRKRGKGKSTTTGKPAQATNVEPAKATPKTREGTKQAQLIAMLCKPKGVTIAEASAAFRWLSHTTRAAISHGIGKRLGLTIESTADEKRGRVYRIVG